jgi:chloramphenicol 3-O-phosphotransferase
MLEHRAIVAVTGIQAAGKSTVARRLAARFARGVHIEADTLQRMIVSGAEWVTEPGEPAGEAARQLRLRLKHTCLLAASFYDAGFSAVLDDIIIDARWHELREDLGSRPVSLVVLAPSVEAVLARDRTRAKRTLGAAWARYLDEALRRTMAGAGLWIDSTHQTPDETVKAIVRGLWPNREAPAADRVGGR